MSTIVEHANICVGNLDETLRFLQTALPSYKVRGEHFESGATPPYRWVHFGDDEHYLALQDAVEESTESFGGYKKLGLNHIGFRVDSVSDLIKRLQDIDYHPHSVSTSHPHRTRAYFHTPDGLEWEFVEYHSQQADERNNYQY
ncbi:VOC family protein [Pleionea sp. CnH1-48]|uniref:VOC family protein n=1 Tax=Pleionea sp. CnH1-48 TaxID=2954494 RepID=UPI002097B921|nr:VOC family protein [Pleionea sp. CnH1-48]MCO7223733.1 VOC family protein [Pleionea sp. CnH1-48]